MGVIFTVNEKRLFMANRMILSGGDVILYEGVMHDAAVIVEDGAIVEVCFSAACQVGPEDTVIDTAGLFVCPGFIDLHNQGGGGFSVMGSTDEDIFGMCRAHGAHGTTGLLLTPPVFGDNFREHLPKLAALKGADAGGAAILGIHAEGPFLNPDKAGCMPQSAIIPPSASLLDEILDCGGGTIMEMTIAPELDGALGLINTLASAGVVPSLGHSLATLGDVLRAVDHGAMHVTHFFNAMSPLNHREPGLAGAALYSTDLTVEVVADGFHVHPWILGLTVQNKGVGRTCLITDSMSAMGLGDGDYEALGLDCHLENGRFSLADDPSVLAGSVLSQDRAVANMVNMVGISLSDAVAMASASPASVIGVDDRKGRIEPGYDADFAILDKRYENVMTIVGGKVVFDKKRDDAE